MLARPVRPCRAAVAEAGWWLSDRPPCVVRAARAARGYVRTQQTGTFVILKSACMEIRIRSIRTEAESERAHLLSPPAAYAQCLLAFESEAEVKHAEILHTR